ncbi:hypothetical protein RFI_20400, partial [Reticulomyxa filosa]
FKKKKKKKQIREECFEASAPPNEQGKDHRLQDFELLQENEKDKEYITSGFTRVSRIESYWRSHLLRQKPVSGPSSSSSSSSSSSLSSPPSPPTPSLSSSSSSSSSSSLLLSSTKVQSDKRKRNCKVAQIVPLTQHGMRQTLKRLKKKNAQKTFEYDGYASEGSLHVQRVECVNVTRIAVDPVRVCVYHFLLSAFYIISQSFSEGIADLKERTKTRQWKHKDDKDNVEKTDPNKEMDEIDIASILELSDVKMDIELDYHTLAIANGSASEEKDDSPISVEETLQQLDSLESHVIIYLLYTYMYVYMY